MLLGAVLLDREDDGVTFVLARFDVLHDPWPFLFFEIPGDRGTVVLHEVLSGALRSQVTEAVRSLPVG